MSQPRLRMANWPAQDYPEWRFNSRSRHQRSYSFYPISLPLSLQRGISQVAIGFFFSTFDFQMFPLGSSHEHTCPLISGLGLHSPEFDQQGVFRTRMFFVFELAEEPKSSSGGEGLQRPHHHNCFSDVLCSLAISIRYNGHLHQQGPEEIERVHFQLVGCFPRLGHIFKSTLHHIDVEQIGKTSLLYYICLVSKDS